MEGGVVADRERVIEDEGAVEAVVVGGPGGEPEHDERQQQRPRPPVPHPRLQVLGGGGGRGEPIGPNSKLFRPTRHCQFQNFAARQTPLGTLLMAKEPITSTWRSRATTRVKLAGATVLGKAGKFAVPTIPNTEGTG